MRRKVMQPRKLSLKFLALANAKARRRRGYKSLVVAKRAKASTSKPLHFVFLKRALFRFLLFFFGRRAGLLNGNAQFSKCIYRLRRSIFFKLRHILLKKKRGFFFGKRLCISKKTFIFPLGSLVNKILLGKVRRRRLSVRKFFLMQRKKFSFKGYYGFTFFLNVCLAPFIFYKGKISKSKVLAFFFLHYARATEWLFLGRLYGRFLLKFSGSYLSVYFITALAWVLPLARSVVSFFFKYRRAIVRRGYPLFAKRKKRALEGIYFSMRGLQRFYSLCLFFKRDFLRGRLAVGFLPKVVVRKGYLPFQIKGKSRPKNGLSDLKKPLRADSRVKSFRSVSTMQLGVRPVDVPGVGARKESSLTLLKPGVVSTDALQPPQEKVYRRPLWLFRHVSNKGGRFRPRSRRRNASRS